LLASSATNKIIVDSKEVFQINCSFGYQNNVVMLELRVCDAWCNVIGEVIEILLP